MALFAAFPAFSDIYRLWRRQAGVVPGELAPEAFEYPPIAAVIFEPLTWLPSARWAVLVNGLVMVVAAIAVTRLIRRHTEPGTSPDTHLWVASPALLFLLPMNWDVAVALTGVGARSSGFSLGVEGWVHVWGRFRLEDRPWGPCPAGPAAHRWSAPSDRAPIGGRYDRGALICRLHRAPAGHMAHPGDAPWRRCFVSLPYDTPAKATSGR